MQDSTATTRVLGLHTPTHHKQPLFARSTLSAVQHPVQQFPVPPCKPWVILKLHTSKCVRKIQGCESWMTRTGLWTHVLIWNVSCCNWLPQYPNASDYAAYLEPALQVSVIFTCCQKVLCFICIGDDCTTSGHVWVDHSKHNSVQSWRFLLHKIVAGLCQ